MGLKKKDLREKKERKKEQENMKVRKKEKGNGRKKKIGRKVRLFFSIDPEKFEGKRKLGKKGEKPEKEKERT